MTIDKNRTKKDIQEPTANNINGKINGKANGVYWAGYTHTYCIVSKAKSE